jgi:hypothetical protein
MAGMAGHACPMGAGARKNAAAAGRSPRHKSRIQTSSSTIGLTQIRPAKFLPALGYSIFGFIASRRVPASTFCAGLKSQMAGPGHYTRNPCGLALIAMQPLAFNCQRAAL